MAMPKGPRSAYAAGLLSIVLLVPLGGWFLSGWAEVRARQEALAQAPRLAADAKARDLARELRAELDALIAREVSRPYFHYQNLMHDPSASAGIKVSPSPLAAGPDVSLVRGYFQLAPDGRATTPTINDELPNLSDVPKLADNRAFRDRVSQELSRHLAPARSVPGRQIAPAQTASPTRVPPTGTAGSPAPRQSQAQVIELDPSVYAQNASPNAVYSQQLKTLKGDNPQKVSQASAVPVVAPPSPVTITISPIEWRTLPFAGAPTLVAARQVQTPDGSLTQGFVVDHSALEAWLAPRATDIIATLRPEASPVAQVASGWGLAAEPSARVVADAAASAAAVERAFITRFAGVGAVAVLAAAVVLLVVTGAEQRARERSQFAAAAAHELRTPLASLQLYGDMLADGLGDPEKTRTYARRISDDAARLGRVVSNVLGFSELERGNLSVDPQAGSLAEALGQIVERAQPALDQAGAAVHLEVPSGLVARFDRDALARIVGNLLDNAEKYTRGAADRTIRLAAADRGEVIEVVVEDRGSGVPDKTTLFRPFSRGAHAGDGPAGLGLGLALSRSLARAMGGELSYRSRDGGGSTFVLQLPRA